MTAAAAIRPCRLTVFAVFVAGATTGCSKADTAQARGRETAAKRVSVETVRTESTRRSVDVVGTLAAVDQVTISSEADGKVSRILADLGDRVSAGATLLRLDNEKQQYSSDQQKAALARALVQYGAPDPQHLPDIEKTPDVQKAAAELHQARQAYERAQELQRRALIPKQQLDDAEANLRAKQAEFDSSLQTAKNLRASIQASEASAKLADRQLRDTDIRAPFDGYVEKRLVNLGELVKTQMPVMTVVRMDPLKVMAEIPERMAPWISTGQPIELRVDAYPDKKFTGKLSRISPTVNTSTRAFPFEALVPNPDASLKPGTFARVHIETGRLDETVTISYAALQYRYGVNRVFVVDGDKLVIRELKVGERLGDRIEILSGVAPGEQVAITDVEKLSDGMKVTTGTVRATE